MKITQAGALVAAAASLSTFTSGYTFSDTNLVKTSTEPSDLTTNDENHIYGGSAADIDDFPFLAALRDPFLDTTICSGTLIAPQYILTAAHCVQKFDNLVATFGANASIGSGSSDDVTRVTVVEQFRHPLYNKTLHLYDVGILKLEHRVNRRPARLCAPDGTNNEVGMMAKVVGWGKTEEAAFSPILEELTLPIISNAKCEKFIKYDDRITDGMLCAGIGNGRDTCSGDSGGPLLVKGDIVVGCVSWGSTCGMQAGVFTRLTYVMDYIEDVLAGGDGSKFTEPVETQNEARARDVAISEPNTVLELPDDSGSDSGEDPFAWLFEGGTMSLMKKLVSGADFSDAFGMESESGSDEPPPAKGRLATTTSDDTYLAKP